jgi:hypothetical protein
MENGDSNRMPRSAAASRHARAARLAAITSRSPIWVARASRCVVEKDQGRERLILCARADAPVTREVVEELLDFARAKLAGVALAVEDDETADPSAVGFLRPDTVMADAQRAPHDIEKLGTVSSYQSGAVPCEARAVAGPCEKLVRGLEIVCSAWPP